MRQFPFSIVGFDLDGTLLDTADDLGAALNHALDLVGRPAVAAQDVRAFIGGGARLMLVRALTASGRVEGVDIDTLHGELVDFYRQNIAVNTRLFPGGEAMLDDLTARGVRMAVVTNKSETLARKLLGEMGLSARFFTILGGDRLGAGRAKPKPDLILEMISRAGKAGRTAFVGDTSFDIDAARAAGVISVAVRFGYADRPVEGLRADAVIGHFDELVPVLERL